MNRYVHPDVLKAEQVVTLAALLKLYLRELPEPLFSYDAYDQVRGHILRELVLSCSLLCVFESFSVSYLFLFPFFYR